MEAFVQQALHLQPMSEMEVNLAATRATEYFNTENNDYFVETKIQDKTPITVACTLVNLKPSKSVDYQYDLPI